MKRLLFDTDKQKETEEEAYIRRYTLLEMLRHRTDPQGVSKIIQRVQKEYHSLEAVKLKRAQIALGRKTEETDGRIHYRFEDLPDQDKAFFKKNTWFIDRMDHFDRAHRVWQNLEKKSPAAAEQVRVWIREILAADEKQDKVKLFGELAEMLQFDQRAFDQKKQEAEEKHKKAPKEPSFRFKTDAVMESRFSREQYQKKDTATDRAAFLQVIRDVFATGQEEAGKEKENPIPIKDFILEMSMFDTQGIVMSHGGDGQSILWADKGERTSQTYKKALLRKAGECVRKMDLLDNALKKYEGDLELHSRLKEKLSPIVLQMGSEEYAKKTANDEKIDKLQSNIEDYTELISRYNEMENLYTDKKKEAEAAGKDVDTDPELMALMVQVHAMRKVAEEASWDGLYGLATSFDEADAPGVIKVAAGRWEVEEGFQIMKTEFEARPVYLSREDRIRAHFLTCFLALLSYRIVERMLGGRFTCPQVVAKLREMRMERIDGEGWRPLYVRDELTDALHEAFGFRTDYEIVPERRMKEIFRMTESATPITTKKEAGRTSK